MIKDPNILESNNKENLAATKIQSGYKGLVIRNKLQETEVFRNANKQLEEKLEGNSSLSRQNSAATKIQAGYKGMVAKKANDSSIRNIKDESSLSRANSAATKIQAGYKGMVAKHESTEKIINTKGTKSSPSALQIMVCQT